jgi:hypothetical protein
MFPPRYVPAHPFLGAANRGMPAYSAYVPESAASLASGRPSASTAFVRQGGDPSMGMGMDYMDPSMMMGGDGAAMDMGYGMDGSYYMDGSASYPSWAKVLLAIVFLIILILVIVALVSCCGNSSDCKPNCKPNCKPPCPSPCPTPCRPPVNCECPGYVIQAQPTVTNEYFTPIDPRSTTPVNPWQTYCHERPQCAYFIQVTADNRQDTTIPINEASLTGHVLQYNCATQVWIDLGEIAAPSGTSGASGSTGV